MALILLERSKGNKRSGLGVRQLIAQTRRFRARVATHQFMLEYSETSAGCEWAKTTGLAESTPVDVPVRDAKHTLERSAERRFDLVGLKFHDRELVNF